VSIRLPYATAKIRFCQRILVAPWSRAPRQCLGVHCCRGALMFMVIAGSKEAPPGEEHSRSLFTSRSRNFPVVNNCAARVKMSTWLWSRSIHKPRYLSQNAIRRLHHSCFSFATFVVSVSSNTKATTDHYDDYPAIPGCLRGHSGGEGLYDGPARYPTANGSSPS
jgi:hypothetical protein